MSTPGRQYDAEAADRVRRTLRAVAETTAVPSVPVIPATFDDARRLEAEVPDGGPGLAGRRRIQFGVVTVGAAAAVIVGFLLLAGNRPTGPAAPAGLGGGEAEGAGGGVDTAAATDVAVPGWVPDGFALDDFEVLDALEGAVEVDLYTDGDQVIGALVSDEPETAHRLAERLEPWSADPAMVPPRDVANDGFMAFGREAGLPATEELVTRLTEGVAAEDAVPDGYDLAASVTTRALPEAGRLVSVTYERGPSVLTVETRQGMLSPELAQVLYPSAAPLEVRGRPGFEAETADREGTRLIWQEAPGLVVSVAASAGLDRPVLDAFVTRLAVVVEDSWVALRRAIGIPWDVDGPVAGMPVRTLAEGEAAGWGYRLEAFDGGSLEHGVTACHRIRLDDATEQVACAPGAQATFATEDTALVWLVVPASVHNVEADGGLGREPVVAPDPLRPGGPQQVVVEVPTGGATRLVLLDAGGAVLATPAVTPN